MSNENAVDSGFRPEWAEVIREEGPPFAEDEVIVVVRKSNHHKPRYSLEVNFSHQNNPTSRKKFHNIHWEGRGRITVIRIADLVASLVAKAEDFIEEAMQKDEDEFMEWKASKEQAAADRGKPVTRTTGKTQRERDKQRGSAKGAA